MDRGDDELRVATVLASRQVAKPEMVPGISLEQLRLHRRHVFHASNGCQQLHAVRNKSEVLKTHENHMNSYLESWIAARK